MEGQSYNNYYVTSNEQRKASVVRRLLNAIHPLWTLGNSSK